MTSPNFDIISTAMVIKHAEHKEVNYNLGTTRNGTAILYARKIQRYGNSESM